MLLFFCIKKEVRTLQRFQSSQLILSIIGLTMIGKGFFYMTHGTYFVWPPGLTMIENDHIVGFMFILVGLLIVLMEIFNNNTPSWFKAIIYGLSVFLMTSVSILEWCHFIFLGMPMSAISNTCITLILLVLAIEGGKLA